jgi:uncharacterized protein YjbI with pentapeptide repeats
VIAIAHPLRNLSGMMLAQVNLSGADLREADLTDANLQDAQMSGADLLAADLSGVEIEHLQSIAGADFTLAQGLSDTA